LTTRHLASLRPKGRSPAGRPPAEPVAAGD
jgi:hypothetical protein